MSPTIDFFLKSGDTASPITATLEDSAGNPVDIQNAAVRWRMNSITASGTPALNNAATNLQNGAGTDGTKGHVSYTWQATDTDQAGLFLGEWVVTFTGGQIETFPNGGYVLVQISSGVL